MRLTELDPNWYQWSHTPGRIGVTFDCPVHRKEHRCAVPFANPLDGAAPDKGRRHLWQRTGETFETLTLQPSVDYTRFDNGSIRDPTCWHGFITNGEVT